MKTMYTDDFPTREELLRLAEEAPEGDPRSWHYRREYPKPKIQWGAAILQFLLPVLLFAAACIFFRAAIWKLAAAALLLIYGILRFKALALFLIQLYQRLAPISIRERCRFEPSCSEYMRLSIEKHGACRGIRRGMARLGRCRTGDGGFDFPE